MALKDQVIRMIRGDPVTVGLDIGNSSVKIVHMIHKPSGPVVAGAGIHVFNEGTIEDGAIKNRDELLRALVSLLQRTDPSGKFRDVNFGLSWSYGVIADRIRLKLSKTESEEDQILMQASQHSPFDEEDIQLDFKILERHLDTGEAEVLLVAARLPMMRPYLSLLRDAGLRVVNVDVDTFAVANAYLNDRAPGDEDKVVCLANIGVNVTNLTFLSKGKYHSTRHVNIAGRLFEQILEKQLGVERIQAASLLHKGDGGEFEQQEIVEAIQAGADELSAGINMALGYFQSSERNLQVDKLVLSGGGACIPGLAEILGDRHHLEIEIANPLGSVPLDARRFSAGVPEDIATMLAVATGLALRKFP